MPDKTRVRPTRRANKNFSAHLFKQIAVAANANTMMIGGFFRLRAIRLELLLARGVEQPGSSSGS